MRLLRLYVGDYRVLRDLDIRFGPPGADEKNIARSASYSLDFLVGVNSTGKSTVLQFLAYLLHSLERHAPISHPFELEYELGPPEQTRNVKLSNLLADSDAAVPQASDTLQILVDNAPAQLSGDILLPLVVAFTTGSEDEWERLEQPEVFSNRGSDAIQALSPVEQALRELPGRPARPTTQDDDRPPSERFLLVRTRQLPLVTLCGLLTDMAEAAQPEQRRLRQVMAEAKIGALRGFSLKCRMPQELTSVTDRETVRLLAQHTSRTLRQGTDYLLVYDLTDREHVLSRQLIENFSNGLELFKTLAALATTQDNEPSVLQQINLFLERPQPRDRGSERPPLHLFEWLSDGEQSFLGRLCLFTLLGSTEALILLDEPEVHFNDYWKRQIVYLLDAALAGRHSHVVITTHSSVTLSDVPRDDIVILGRDLNFTSHAFPPSMQTFAADPSDIMVHVFNAPVAAGAQSVEIIERALAAAQHQDPPTRQAALERLLNIVGPGYWRYRLRRALLETETE